MRTILAPIAFLMTSCVHAVTAHAGTDKDDIAAFQKSKITLAAAATAAEKAGGGKAIDAVFDEEDNGGKYKIAVIVKNKTEHYLVDAMASAPNAVRDTSLLAKADREGKDERDGVTSAKVSLTQAIATAESSAGGKAIEAEFEDHGKTATFDIAVVVNNSVVEVSIDPATGNVIKTK